MEFDLDSFVRNHFLQQLNKCKKVDLMLIANLFDVQMPVHAKKEELQP